MRVGRTAVGAAVGAVNGLTARWAEAGEGGTVFSAAGVWPLLAFLADGAAGHARTELAEALEVPTGRAADAARKVLALVGSVRGLRTAVGLWTRRTLELRPEWAAGLPADVHGVLTGDLAADEQSLDAWAADRTGGLIEHMPAALTDDTELVLASALSMRTRWLRPFEEAPLETAYEPWATTEVLGLRRSSTLLDRVGVADTRDGRVTELKVLGANALDVHLLLGDDRMTPGQVLGAGIGVLAGRHPVVPGPQLPYGDVGPGLSVEKERCTRPRRPTLEVTTAAYDLRAEHDLLALHRLFGLTAARERRPGHFPGVSGFPLAVGSGRQSTMARFGARGFEAAAVTAIGAYAGGLPDPRYVTTTIHAVYDRLFAFLAVHRHSRLVLAAGWVAEATPYDARTRDLGV